MLITHNNNLSSLKVYKYVEKRTENLREIAYYWNDCRNKKTIN